MESLISKDAAFVQNLLNRHRNRSLGNKPPIPIDTLLKLSEDKYKLADHTLYVKANVKGASGDFRILDGNSDYKEGTISVDKGRLPAGENLFFSKVLIGYGKDAAETDPAKIQYTTVINTANLDLALRGADLEILQDTRQLVRKPVEEFLSEAASHFVRGSRQVALELDSVQYFVENQQITIRLIFPNGQSVGSANEHHIGIWIPGLKTVPR